MLNKDLAQAIQSEIAQAKAEGMDEDDIKWMAQGAAIRYGREQGVIGDEVSPEMQAALAQAVKQEMKQK